MLSRARDPRSLNVDWRQYLVYIGFVALFLFFAVTLRDAGFTNPNNLLNIVRQTAIIATMAVAMTFVIAAGQIDLSVGAIAGLSSVTTALTIASYGPLAGVLVGLLTGLVVGAVNGLLTTLLVIPSFLVTLGMMGVARGSAMWLTNTAPVPILNQAYNNIFGSGQVGPIPSLLIWIVVVTAIGFVVLRKTPYGRQVLATGGNEQAARFSGVNTRPLRRLRVGHRLGARRPAHRSRQQRADPDGSRDQPTDHHPRRHHHHRGRAGAPALVSIPWRSTSARYTRPHLLAQPLLP
ncbi:MAG: inositol transport system permease protein [Thermomicrobiales bacterium]|nr:inositol transport system permease protein [Thermomicrobiales bacterium]